MINPMEIIANNVKRKKLLYMPEMIQFQDLPLPAHKVVNRTATQQTFTFQFIAVDRKSFVLA